MNGTTTSLNPVVGLRFHDPWNETYKLLKVLSNLLSMGAEWAWKTREGGTVCVLQDASLNVLFGARTNRSPTLNCESVKSLGFHIGQHVGYPYHWLFGFVTSPI